MNRNLKLSLAIIYLICFCTLLYWVFSNFDFRELTNYSYIKDRGKILIDYKNDHFIKFSIIFFTFSVAWILLLGFASPLAILFGFVYGKFLGTIISAISITIGCTLLYIFAKIFFKKFIHNYLEKKILKFKSLFNKNEFFYYLIFRFSGGGGIPFAIQNLLPLVFDMKIKNYFNSTLLGILPIIFILNSLGSGLESLVSQNKEISLLNFISTKEIYIPILGFFIILMISIYTKKKFFKKD